MFELCEIQEDMRRLSSTSASQGRPGYPYSPKACCKYRHRASSGGQHTSLSSDIERISTALDP